MERKNKKEILSNLWKIMDDLRGYESSTDILQLICILLIFRWLDKQDREQQAIAVFDEIEYTPILPEKISWSTIIKNFSVNKEYNLNNLLEECAEVISDKTFKQLFQRTKRLFNTLNFDRILVQKILQIIDALPFETIREIELSGLLIDCLINPEKKDSIIKRVSFLDAGNSSLKSVFIPIIESLLSIASVQTNNGNGNGTFSKKISQTWEYITPEFIVDIIIKLISPEPGEKIYDPCFGFGSFLIEAVRTIKKKSDKFSPIIWNNLQTENVFGMELNIQAYIVTFTRLLLEGITRPGLELGNTLESHAAVNNSHQKFDCIMAYPPFGQKTDDIIQSYYPIKTRDTASLFIQHIIQSLNPNGRAIIIVPEKFLISGGPTKELRKKLLKEYCVEGVISLPPGIFQPFTAIKTNILIIKKTTPSETIRFMKITEKDYKEFESFDKLSLDKMILSYKKFEVNENMWNVSVKWISRNDYDLSVRKSDDDKFEKFIDSIKKVVEDMPFKTLDRIASITAGVPYDKNVITSEKGIPLIRISDINEDKILLPEKFIKKEIINKNTENKFIQSGDILISASGTIGKVAIVKNTKKMLPAKNLIIIRSNSSDILPEYLFLLLKTKHYQNWFEGHARGSVIKNLSIRLLRSVIIPVPSLQVQETVYKIWSEHGGSADTILLKILSGEKINPVINWFESSEEVNQLLNINSYNIQKDRIIILNRFIKGLKNIRNIVAHSSGSSLPPEVSVFVLKLNSTLENIDNISNIPVSTALFSLLESVKNKLSVHYYESEKINLNVKKRIQDIIENLQLLLSDEIKSIMLQYDLSFQIEPDRIVSGITTEITLLVENKSNLPIRDFSVRTIPDYGRLIKTYLAEKGTININLKIPAQLKPGSLEFTVEWKGKLLDGTHTSGEKKMLLTVKSLRDKVINEEIGLSPYNGQDPVQKKEMLYGRNDILNSITNHLSKSSPANVILLEGNRRTGKTSILNRIIKYENITGYIPVLCSFQGGQGSSKGQGLPTKEIFRLIIREVTKTIYQIKNIEINLFDIEEKDKNKPYKHRFIMAFTKQFTEKNYFELFKIYLEEILDKISPFKLLLLLDEFDKIQEGIESGITSPIVPENLRYLLYSYDNLAAIVSGSKRLKKLREHYWSALFGLGETIAIGPINYESASKLITEPVAGQLQFITSAKDRIIELCACRPNLIQSFCDKIFNYAKEYKIRIIDDDIVNNIADNQMILNNEHFSTIWDTTKTAFRRLILMLLDEMERERIASTFSELADRIHRKNKILDINILEDEINILRELELVDLENINNNIYYKISAPLFAKWMNVNQDKNVQINRARKEVEAKL